MEPIRYDGASVDIGVLKRLRRLDRQLRVTFSPYSLDVFTGLPTIRDTEVDPYTGEWGGGAVVDPAFYLWRKDSGSSHHWFVNVYRKFTHEEVMHLEADVARFHRPDMLFKILEERSKLIRNRQLAAKKTLQNDKIRANRRRIGDLVFEGKDGTRDAKVSSYRGQTRRTSSSERGRIVRDAREDGWELPEEPAQ